MRNSKKTFLSLLIAALLLFTSVPSWAVEAADVEGSDNTVSAVDLNSKAAAEMNTVTYDRNKQQTSKVKISRGGTFLIDLYGDGNSSKVWLTNGEGKQMGKSISLTQEGRERTLVAEVEKGGIYSLNFDAEGSKTVSTGFRAYYAPAGDIDVEFDKLYYGSGASITYFKIKTPLTGYITVDIPECMKDKTTYGIKVLDKNRKTISSYYDLYVDMDDTFNYNGYLGLDKGTYYLAIQTSDPAYGLKLSFKSVKKSTGTTRKKAVNLLKGQGKSGILHGDYYGDWYKFTIKKRQKVTFAFEAKTGIRYLDELTVYFYKESDKMSFKINYLEGRSDNYQTEVTFPKNSKTLAPGTYYVRVRSNSSWLGGYYSIRWLK